MGKVRTNFQFVIVNIFGCNESIIQPSLTKYTSLYFISLTVNSRNPLYLSISVSETKVYQIGQKFTKTYLTWWKQTQRNKLDQSTPTRNKVDKTVSSHTGGQLVTDSQLSQVRMVFRGLCKASEQLMPATRQWSSKLMVEPHCSCGPEPEFNPFDFMHDNGEGCHHCGAHAKFASTHQRRWTCHRLSTPHSQSTWQRY